MNGNGYDRPRRKYGGRALMTAGERQHTENDSGSTVPTDTTVGNGLRQTAELHARLARRVRTGTNHDDPKQKKRDKKNGQALIACGEGSPA